MTKRKLITLLTIIIGLTAAVCLTACAPKLDTPQNFKVSQDYLLTWEEVEGASAYMLCINGNVSSQYMTKETSFDITSSSQLQDGLNSGNNTMQVRAITLEEDSKGKTAPNQSSAWSQEVTFNFVKKARSITQITINADNQTISWQTLGTKDAPGEVTYSLAYRQGEGDWQKYVIASPQINQITGDATFSYSEALSSEGNGTYQISILAGIEGYVDSDAEVTYEVNWAGGTPVVQLTSISAMYSGGSVTAGGNLDLTKVIVTAHYSNNSSTTVTNWTHDFDSTTQGIKTVTINYTEGAVTKSATVSVTVTSASQATKDYTITWQENWIGNDSAVVLVWAWGQDSEGSWYATTYVQGTDSCAVSVALPSNLTGAVLVRFPSGTTTQTANWSNLYNQTNNVDLTQGTTLTATTKTGQ